MSEFFSATHAILYNPLHNCKRKFYRRNATGVPETLVRIFLVLSIVDGLNFQLHCVICWICVSSIVLIWEFVFTWANERLMNFCRESEIIFCSISVFERHYSRLTIVFFLSTFAHFFASRISLTFSSLETPEKKNAILAIVLLRRYHFFLCDRSLKKLCETWLSKRFCYIFSCNLIFSTDSSFEIKRKRRIFLIRFVTVFLQVFFTSKSAVMNRSRVSVLL